MALKLWPSPVDFSEAFTEETDPLGYKEYAYGFAGLVVSLKDQPATIVLDGHWGSGKTTFIRKWIDLLSRESVFKKPPVIYFDAFEADHNDDAFFQLMAAILEFADKNHGAETPIVKKAYARTADVVRKSLPAATRIGIRAGTMGLIGLEDMLEVSEIARSVLKGASGELEASVGKAIEESLKNATTKSRTVESFKVTLKELSRALRQSEGPLIVVVDELDRCRPPFALALLERIKHLFSVEGVVFVLVTNLDHMAAAVQGAYGADTNGSMYLEKFYDLRTTLPDKTTEHDGNKSVRSTYVEYLFKTMGFGEEYDSCCVVLKHLVERHNLKFREIEKCLRSFAVYRLSYPTNKIDPVLDILICVVRQSNQRLFSEMKNGNVSTSEIEEYLAPKLLKKVADIPGAAYGAAINYMITGNPNTLNSGPLKDFITPLLGRPPETRHGEVRRKANQFDHFWDPTEDKVKKH